MFIIFSFFVVIFSFIFILLILLVFVSTYFTFIGHCTYTIYNYLEGKAYLLRAIIVRGVPSTYPLFFFANYFYNGTFHVVLRNSHLLWCFCSFVFKFSRKSFIMREEYFFIKLDVKVFKLEVNSTQFFSSDGIEKGQFLVWKYVTLVILYGKLLPK